MAQSLYLQDLVRGAHRVVDDRLARIDELANALSVEMTALHGMRHRVEINHEHQFVFVIATTRDERAIRRDDLREAR